MDSTLKTAVASAVAGAAVALIVSAARQRTAPAATVATKKDIANAEARLRKEIHHRRAAIARDGASSGAGAGAGAGSAPSTPVRLSSLANTQSPLAVGLVTRTNAKPPSSPYPAVPALLRSQQKRVLVTGGAGFVGSHLVDVLMMQGHLVYVLDNLFTGSRQNFTHWEGHPNFVFFQRDVVEPFFIEVDEIYHLACPASPPHYQYNAIKTIKCSTLGTLNMLGLAKRCKARLLFTSTSEVYGDPEVHPQPETYWGNVNCLGPRACYDEGKRVAETMCLAYREENGVDVRIARIFNTFGPRMHPDDGRVVSNFIKQALQGDPLTVYGDGKQTRSFQFVEDLVRGLITLMNSNVEQPVNIGNPDEYTIGDFARKIATTIDATASVVHKPATKDDPRQRKPDISRAKALLGWQPRVSVEAGLDKTILYFKHELGCASAADEDPPAVWMPEIPDLHLGCMGTRREPPVYK